MARGMVDIQVRDATPDDAAAMAHVIVSATNHGFRELVPPQCLSLTEAKSASNWFRTLQAGLPPGDFMVIAQSRATGEPVAYAWGGPSSNDDSPYRGELKQINLLPDVQRTGIGRALVGHVATRLAGQGITSMSVDVLQVNPNRAFYERLGARLVSERDYDWSGVKLTMCTYGWADTAALRDD